MNWYKIIKDAYTKGLYTDEQVDIFAEKGKITKKQAKEIKGAA